MQPTTDRPSLWLALSLVTGLPILLWAYKSTMIYIFQRKIIYMGYAPPGARSEELEKDVPSRYLKGIRCEEIAIRSQKNVTLSGIIVRRSLATDTQDLPPETVIVYFQGNAGNPLHRLPVFQTLLRPSQFHHKSIHADSEHLAIVAAVPRSYWKSTLRAPTEKRIVNDYIQILKYTLTRFPDAHIIVYGHSLGASVAICLLSQLYDETDRTATKDPDHEVAKFANIKGLVVENPFSSIPEMTKVLYPRWTPYHYMAPLAWDKWDALSAMRNARGKTSVLSRLRRDTMIVVSEKDELVPKTMGEELWEAVNNDADDENSNGFGRKVVIRDALHENAWMHRQWLKEMMRYIAEVRRRP